jgi:acetyl-CoA synthetase
VVQAAAIGVPHELKGQDVVAFAVLQPGFESGEALRAELESQVARELG